MCLLCKVVENRNKINKKKRVKDFSKVECNDGDQSNFLPQTGCVNQNFRRQGDQSNASFRQF